MQTQTSPIGSDIHYLVADADSDKPHRVIHYLVTDAGSDKPHRPRVIHYLVTRGGSRGGHTRHAPPLKLEKI